HARRVVTRALGVRREVTTRPMRRGRYGAADEAWDEGGPQYADHALPAAQCRPRVLTLSEAKGKDRQRRDLTPNPARGQPTSTVGSPKMSDPPCTVVSLRRPAGMPPTSTVGDPIGTTDGGPTHVHID